MADCSITAVVDSGDDDSICVMMIGGGVAVTERGAKTDDTDTDAEEEVEAVSSFGSASLTELVVEGVVVALIASHLPVANNTLAKMGAFTRVAGIG